MANVKATGKSKKSGNVTPTDKKENSMLDNIKASISAAIADIFGALGKKETEESLAERMTSREVVTVTPGCYVDKINKNLVDVSDRLVFKVGQFDEQSPVLVINKNTWKDYQNTEESMKRKNGWSITSDQMSFGIIVTPGSDPDTKPRVACVQKDPTTGEMGVDDKTGEVLKVHTIYGKTTMWMSSRNIPESEHANFYNALEILQEMQDTRGRREFVIVFQQVGDFRVKEDNTMSIDMYAVAVYDITPDKKSKGLATEGKSLFRPIGTVNAAPEGGVRRTGRRPVGGRVVETTQPTSQELPDVDFNSIK